MTRFTIPTPEELARPTPLVDCPNLASRFGVARVLAKLESERPLGNFKSLGGMVAATRALRRAAQAAGFAALPPLICASDGNHGLAVAAGARAGGSHAIVYLHKDVDSARAGRIRDAGATVRWVSGTYDDAVVEAAAAAAAGHGILVPDTSSDPDDIPVREVMHGYRRIVDELIDQLPRMGASPSHVYVQAGVGGLAAAIAEGSAGFGNPRLRIVEPGTAACVAHALATGRIERIAGDLETKAEMLSCGVASAAAVEVLRRHQPECVLVSEADLAEAVELIERDESIATTPSGAAGLAGLLHECDTGRSIAASSIVLLLVTERTVPLARD
jgi:diaminopropionate ammonia-lyase